MSGIWLLLLLAACIGLLITGISRWKIHPFLALMGTALLLALSAGVELTAVAEIIGRGFSDVFTSVGLVLILGAVIGTVLEKTGAALTIADAAIRLTGKRHPELALLLMGRVVSMSVFCDSAFVILDPIRRALVSRTGRPGAACTAALSLGLYITQCLMVPAPGPVAAADAIYGGMGLETDLLQVIAAGLVCSILPTAAAYVFSCGIAGKIKEAVREDTEKQYDALLAEGGERPGLCISLLPVLAPIGLMAASGVAGWAGWQCGVLVFFGKPAIALAAGLLLSFGLLKRCGLMSRLYELTEEALRMIAPILFVIAAGNALGAVIAATQLEAFVREHAFLLQGMGLLFPFLLAALLKTAIGSSTVAITTTAGILAPLMNTLGFAAPWDAALAVCAVAAGAMTVCHANDSYFWVVVSSGGLQVKDGYRIQTIGTLVTGLAALLSVLLLSMI